jgi:flagellar basal body-associated protein FliL
VGLNTALTGFGLIDSTRDGFRRKRLAAILAGVVVVLVSTAAVALLFWKMTGPAIGGLDPDGWGLVGGDKLWILLSVGIVTSWLGGALAEKYFKLNQGIDPERRT